MSLIEMKKGVTVVSIPAQMKQEFESRGYKVKEPKQSKPVFKTKEVKEDGKV